MMQKLAEISENALNFSKAHAPAHHQAAHTGTQLLHNNHKPLRDLSGYCSDSQCGKWAGGQAGLC